MKDLIDSADRYEALRERAYQTERCTCGRLRSEHGDIHYSGVPTTKGHGTVPGKCLRYTWDGKSGPFAVK